MPTRSNAVGEPPTHAVASAIADIVEDSTRITLADATLTSGISIQKFCCVVSQFSNFKRGLVTETGFGGLMHLKITTQAQFEIQCVVDVQSRSGRMLVRIGSRKEDPNRKCYSELELRCTLNLLRSNVLRFATPAVYSPK